MSVTNESNDSSTETQNDETEYWEVEKYGVSLRKISYSRYELSSGAFRVEFSDIRERDGEYELRDSSRNVLGYFDPNHDGIDDRIEKLFKVTSKKILSQNIPHRKALFIA